MKKIIALSAAVVAMQGIAFAGGIPTTLMKGDKPFTFKPSSNVEISYYTDNSSTKSDTTVNTNYIANSKNTSGNRIFSTSSNTSNIYYQENDAWKGLKLADTTKEMSDPTKTTDAEYKNAGGWSSQ